MKCVQTVNVAVGGNAHAGFVAKRSGPKGSVGWPKRALVLTSKAYMLSTLRLLRDLHTAASAPNIH